MKTSPFVRWCVILAGMSAASNIAQTAGETASPPRFQPNFGSLERHEVPAWFEDAKLGIWRRLTTRFGD